MQRGQRLAELGGETAARRGEQGRQAVVIEGAAGQTGEAQIGGKTRPGFLQHSGIDQARHGDRQSATLQGAQGGRLVGPEFGDIAQAAALAHELHHRAIGKVEHPAPDALAQQGCRGGVAARRNP